MDSTFGPDHTGKVLGALDMDIYGLTTQKVGEKEWIVAVGRLKDLTGVSRILWTVVRYSPEGALDLTFGGNGTGFVQEAFGGNGGSMAHAALIQPDGKILVVGDGSVQKIVQNVPAVVRYLGNGARDTSFGSGGRVTVPLYKSLGSADAVALQSDGKIVAAGCYLYPCSLAVFRLNPNGALDPTFNASSSYPGQYFYPPYPSQGRGVVIQKVGTEEKIVVAGTAPTAPNSYRAGVVVRLTSKGVLDTTFGDLDSTGTARTGVALTHFGPTNIDYYMTLQLDSSNRLVAAGESDDANGTPYRMIMARYTPNGSLDTTFGAGGIYSPAPPLEGEAAQASALQPDGKILLAGPGNGLKSFSTWRFLDNGTLDVNFGSNGWMPVDFGGNSYFPYAMALQADGKFVTAGHARFANGASSCTYAAVARQFQ